MLSVHVHFHLVITSQCQDIIEQTTMPESRIAEDNCKIHNRNKISWRLSTVRATLIVLKHIRSTHAKVPSKFPGLAVCLEQLPARLNASEYHIVCPIIIQKLPQLRQHAQVHRPLHLSPEARPSGSRYRSSRFQPCQLSYWN